MKITITPMMLCDLLGGKFTLEACEAIAEYYNMCDCAPHIGDIICSFGELKAEEAEEGDNILAQLDNGNVVISY